MGGKEGGKWGKGVGGGRGQEVGVRGKGSGECLPPVHPLPPHSTSRGIARTTTACITALLNPPPCDTKINWVNDAKINWVNI